MQLKANGCVLLCVDWCFERYWGCIWDQCKAVPLWLWEEGSVAYIPCVFAFYVLTLEDRKCFPTQNHPPLNLFPPLAHSDVILLRIPAACTVRPIQSSFQRFFLVIWSGMHVFSPQMDNVGSGLPMEISIDIFTLPSNAIFTGDTNLIWVCVCKNYLT